MPTRHDSREKKRENNGAGPTFGEQPPRIYPTQLMRGKKIDLVGEAPFSSIYVRGVSLPVKAVVCSNINYPAAPPTNIPILAKRSTRAAPIPLQKVVKYAASRPAKNPVFCSGPALQGCRDQHFCVQNKSPEISRRPRNSLRYLCPGKCASASTNGSAPILPTIEEKRRATS